MPFMITKACVMCAKTLRIDVYLSAQHAVHVRNADALPNAHGMANAPWSALHLSMTHYPHGQCIWPCHHSPDTDKSYFLAVAKPSQTGTVLTIHKRETRWGIAVKHEDCTWNCHNISVLVIPRKCCIIPHVTTNIVRGLLWT
jgi:hypothetical protein